MPNVNQAAGQNYNYEAAPGQRHLTQQPAIRVDYQLSSSCAHRQVLRKPRAASRQPGTIVGFTTC